MSDMLSSDILERQFGPTELEVLYQRDLRRIIRTKVAASGQVLELSQVSFKPEGVSAFADVHRQVMDGMSMGKAFAGQGVAFRRQTRGVHIYQSDRLPAGFAGQFASEGPATVVEVSIFAGPDGIPYADILEVYNPVVKWPESATPPDKTALESLDKFGASLHSIYTDDMGIDGVKRNGSRSKVGETEGPVSQRPPA